MTGEQAQSTTFGRGSNVLEYWLAHAEGFDIVSGRRPRRRVDHVIVDRQLGNAAVLVVRRRHGRRTRVIPVSTIAAVDPFERLLYVTPKRRSRTNAGRAAGSALRAQRAAATWARPRLVEAARVSQSATYDAWHWSRPRLVVAALLARRWSVDAARVARVAAARVGALLAELAARLQPHVIEVTRRSRSWSRLAAARGARVSARLRSGIAAGVRRAIEAIRGRGDVRSVRDGS